MKRVFLVGCPRSGSTLLQGLIAAHPQVTSFPESHFFSKIIGGKKIYRKLGLVSPFTGSRINKFLQTCNRPDLKISTFKPLWTGRRATRVFVDLLDQMAVDQNAEIWLEKTPRHLHFIERIESLVSKPRFIHIVRSGKDVIASLYDVTRRHSQAWEGAMDLESSTDRWLHDIEITRRHEQRENHLKVAYQQIVHEQKQTLSKIFEWLDLSPAEVTWEDYKSEMDRLTVGGETWKNKNYGQIKDQDNRKFYQILDKEQQQYVINRIS